MRYRNQSTAIRISLSQHRLFLYEQQILLHHWPIAIGKPLTPTPVGRWHIINKKILSGGPYGTRWLGLDNPSYGIHGTNAPESIGTNASLGCIRMHNRHIETLFPLVRVGTTVDIML